MYELGYATEMADRLVGILEPCCHKIAVAGSIRRKRPQVKDIDLVAIPSNLSALGITLMRYGEILTKKRLDTKTKIIKYRFQGIAVEIYIASEENLAHAPSGAHRKCQPQPGTSDAGKTARAEVQGERRGDPGR